VATLSSCHSTSSHLRRRQCVAYNVHVACNVQRTRGMQRTRGVQRRTYARSTPHTWLQPLSSHVSCDSASSHLRRTAYAVHDRGTGLRTYVHATVRHAPTEPFIPQSQWRTLRMALYGKLDTHTNRHTHTHACACMHASMTIYTPTHISTLIVYRTLWMTSWKSRSHGSSSPWCQCATAPHQSLQTLQRAIAHRRRFHEGLA